jgi:hypothetical protein
VTVTITQLHANSSPLATRADSCLFDGPAAFIDVETTGGRAGWDRIIEIGRFVRECRPRFNRLRRTTTRVIGQRADLDAV